ncbi:MAG: hypothetical protein EOO72_02355 [Myxococcaceae bacterium]|nr:MAG: hypothetical protein EOO72_02355 [Myxococcaceae bacterium]
MDTTLTIATHAADVARALDPAQVNTYLLVLFALTLIKIVFVLLGRQNQLQPSASESPFQRPAVRRSRGKKRDTKN